MLDFFVSFINFISLAPVIYLGGVAFTASTFTWMKSLVNEYHMKTEWPYILLILVNGMIPTILSAFPVSVVANINPAIIVLLTPVFAILEFALLSRDSIRTYVFFAGMIMLHFACLFGISATIITCVRVPETVITPDVIHASSLTLSLFLLSASFIMYTLSITGITDILKKILHDWTTGTSLLAYMIINGVILAIATGFDYEVYFSDPTNNPFRNVTVIGMVLRYVLILITSGMLIYVQCRMEISKKKALEYEAASYTDPLTGLLNRAGMNKAMSDLNQTHSNKNTTVMGALFMLDLDHFKEVNDNLGHPVGDEMLTKASSTLKSLFRDTDYVCRLGGDEFCVFFNGWITEDIIRNKCELLNQQLRFSYTTPEGLTINTSTSIGVAFLPDHGPDYTALYHNADEALYRAKEGGRNCYRIASNAVSG